VKNMKVTRRVLFAEDAAATVVTAAAVLAFTTTHERWNVAIIGDSRRWTAGLLCVLAVLMLALVVRHIGTAATAVVAVAMMALAIVAIWTASLTPLSLLAASFVLAWAVAMIRDVFAPPHARIVTH
jgi:hypothetical protein